MNQQTHPGANFFAKTIAESAGYPTPLGMGHYFQMMNTLMSACERDSEIEFVMILRKGSKTALVGVADGKPITDGDTFQQILLQSAANL